MLFVILVSFAPCHASAGAPFRPDTSAPALAAVAPPTPLAEDVCCEGGHHTLHDDSCCQSAKHAHCIAPRSTLDDSHLKVAPFLPVPSTTQFAALAPRPIANPMAGLTLVSPRSAKPISPSMRLLI